MRILLAEDERELANWLVRALQQSGFRSIGSTTAAWSGAA